MAMLNSQRVINHPIHKLLLFLSDLFCFDGTPRLNVLALSTSSPFFAQCATLRNGNLKLVEGIHSSKTLLKFLALAPQFAVMSLRRADQSCISMQS